MIKTAGILGLARRAGKLSVGTETVCETVRKHKSRAVIIASDVSENTKKRIFGVCAHYGVRYYGSPMTGTQLALCVGKGGFTAAVSVNDDNFLIAVEKAIDEDGGCVYGSTD